MKSTASVLFQTIEAPVKHALPFFSPLFLVFLLSGCAEPAAEQYRLAERGLFSGAISPDGGHVAAGSILHGGSLWATEGYERLYDWNLAIDRENSEFTPFTAMDWSGNGARVASVHNRQLVVWSAQTGQSLAFFEAPAEIRAVALNDSGDRLLLGLSDGLVVLYDTDSGELLRRLTAHRAPVNALDMSGDGRFAVSGGDDQKAVYWSLEEGRVQRQQQHGNRLGAVALSPDGRYVLSAAHGEDARIWRTRDGVTVRELPSAQTVVASARFLEDSRRVMVGNRRNGIVIWSLENLERLRSWRLDGQGLYARESQVILDVRWLGSYGLALSSGGSLAFLR